MAGDQNEETIMAEGSVTMGVGHYQSVMRKLKEAGAEVKGYGGALLAKRSTQALMTVGGAAIGWYILSNKSWSDKIGVFKAHWWLKPLLVLAVGWWAWRKEKVYAGLILAIGAALFAQAWRTESNITAKPPIESGDVAWDADAGQWVKTGTGGEVLMPAGGTDESSVFARSVFEKARAA
jgi:hypothetical protein